MRDVAGEAVRATAVGARGSVRHSPSDGTLADFQAVVAELDRLSACGAITILSKHRESQSTDRFIDAVLFARLR